MKESGSYRPVRSTASSLVRGKWIERSELGIEVPAEKSSLVRGKWIESYICAKMNIDK